MAYTLSTLLTEFYARGFAFLNDSGAGTTRATQWINLAVAEIDGQEDWPYLTATTTGVAPLTITDLQTIESVTDTTRGTTLEPRDRRDLRDWYGDLTIGGYPLYYYLVNSVINVFPANTSTTLTVDYYRVSPVLSSGSDQPLMPDRFRPAIVDFAVSFAQRDAGNEQDAQAAKQAGLDIVGRMGQVLLGQQHQQPMQFVRAVGEDL